MRQLKITSSLLLGLMLGVSACAGAKPVATMAATAGDVQTQSSATAVQSFIAVEGADLMAKLDAARERARSKPVPYWSAYAFDVRSGVAIDPAIKEFHGSMNTIGDTTLFVGTTADGQTVETKNLAIFLLRDPASNQITRMEIYNLERKREYSGYPVYWLGRANNEESLNYLRALGAAAPLDRLSERAVLGIALHDDQRVGGMLKTFVTTSPNQKIRSSSIYWLGQVGGETTFLASLVKNEAEDKKFRRQAAYAIGQSHDRGVMSMIQSLYEEVKLVEIRQGLINAAGDCVEQQPAFAFLLGIAKTDINPELRKQAMRALSERGEAAIDDLLKLFDSEQSQDVRRTALQALAEIKSPRVDDKLFAVAGSNENLEVRKQAIRLLGERVGRKSLEFLGATAQSADGNAEVQMQAVRSIGEHHSEESVPLLIKIAKTHPNQLVRKQAIRALGDSGDPRAVEFFREVLAKE